MSCAAAAAARSAAASMSSRRRVLACSSARLASVAASDAASRRSVSCEGSLSLTHYTMHHGQALLPASDLFPAYRRFLCDFHNSPLSEGHSTPPPGTRTASTRMLLPVSQECRP